MRLSTCRPTTPRFQPVVYSGALAPWAMRCVCTLEAFAPTQASLGGTRTESSLLSAAPQMPLNCSHLSAPSHLSQDFGTRRGSSPRHRLLTHPALPPLLQDLTGPGEPSSHRHAGEGVSVSLTQGRGVLPQRTVWSSPVTLTQAGEGPAVQMESTQLLAGCLAVGKLSNHSLPPFPHR